MTLPGRHTRPVCNQVFFCFSSQPLDHKPPSRACQWSTVSHSICFLDLTVPSLHFHFRHLCQYELPFNQTMVKVRVQPLHSMASHIAHDSFLQEAIPFLPLFSILKKCITNGRDVTRASHTSRLSPGFTRSLKLCQECGFKPFVCVFFILWGHVG